MHLRSFDPLSPKARRSARAGALVCVRRFSLAGNECSAVLENNGGTISDFECYVSCNQFGMGWKRRDDVELFQSCWLSLQEMSESVFACYLLSL